MSYRAARLIVASGLALCGATGVEAQTVVTPLFPGITHIKRTEQYPAFQCPGCPAPTPNPRLARMNILLVDLTSPAVRFKLTPPGENLPAVAPGSTTPNWPVVPFEVVRQRTLDFLNTSHAQAAINVHFFAPFPVPGGSTQSAYAYVIGLAASRGKVYSGFESPIQSYAIVTNSPGLNIDSSNSASIVHRDPASAGWDGRRRERGAVERPRRIRPDPDERRQDDPGVHGRHPPRRAPHPRPGASARLAAADVHARRAALVRPEQRAHGHRRDRGRPDAGAVHGRRHQRRPRHAGGRSSRPAQE